MNLKLSCISNKKNNSESCIFSSVLFSFFVTKVFSCMLIMIQDEIVYERSCLVFLAIFFGIEWEKHKIMSSTKINICIEGKIKRKKEIIAICFHSVHAQVREKWKISVVITCWKLHMAVMIVWAKRSQQVVNWRLRRVSLFSSMMLSDDVLAIHLNISRVYSVCYRPSAESGWKIESGKIKIDFKVKKISLLISVRKIFTNNSPEDKLRKKKRNQISWE